MSEEAGSSSTVTPPAPHVSFPGQPEQLGEGVPRRLSGLAMKRGRSWDIDCSLEELVSWDVLDQFMNDPSSAEGGDMGTKIARRFSREGAPPLLSQLSGGGGMPPHAMMAGGALGGGVPRLDSSGGLGGAQAISPRLDAAFAQLPGVLPPAFGYDPTAALGGGGGAGAGVPGGAGGPGGDSAALAHSLWSAAWFSMPGMAAQGAVPLDDGLGLGLGGHYGLEPGGGSPFDGAVGVGGHGHGGGGAGRPNQKQRFVWTAELHHRFEAAVNTLGIDHAKPQAISQLMDCEGEGAPTRQNIKSHLQKYRLFFSKRLGRRGAKGGGGDDDDGEPSPLDPYLERQHNGLLAQLELHAKLHTQLLIQRSTQAALSLRMSHSQGRPALHPLQLQRLARHVLMQRNMLQHLVALLHSSTVEILAERGVPPGQIEAMAHQALSPLALGVGAQGGAPRGGAFGDASASGGAGGLGAQHTLYYPDQVRCLPGPAQRFLWCRIAPESDRIRPSSRTAV